MSQRNVFDEIDCAMLDLLQNNGRASNVTIARHLNLSETPCWRRMKNLEEQGVIKGYHALLDRNKVGLGVIVFVEISFSTHSDTYLEDFEKAVQNIPEVLSCHNISGESDYLLQIVSESLDAYEELSRNVIRRLPGVNSVKSSFSLKEIKNSIQLPIGPKVLK